MSEFHKISLTLAGMMLLRNGQITLDEIEALPFVENRQDALAIARRLLNTFGNAYRVELRTGGDLSRVSLSLEGVKAATEVRS